MCTVQGGSVVPGNISLLYGGTAAEQVALHYAAWLGASLEARVEVRYARDPLGVLDEEQRAQYRNLLELGGWDHAHRYLVETFRKELAEDAEQAAHDFRGSPASRHLAWGKPLDLGASAGEVLDSLAYRRDLLMAGSIRLWSTAPSATQGRLRRSIKLRFLSRGGSASTGAFRKLGRDYAEGRADSDSGSVLVSP